MFSRKFSASCFSPPPKKKSHPKLSAVLSNSTFWSPRMFHADFLLTGETNISSTSPKATIAPKCLVAPYRTNRCDTPYRAIPQSFREVNTPPKWCNTPHVYLVSHRRICAISHFATYRAVIVRYPLQTSLKEFCDTITRSISRYEKKFRCWATTLKRIAGRTCVFRESIKFYKFDRTLISKEGQSVQNYYIISLFSIAVV